MNLSKLHTKKTIFFNYLFLLVTICQINILFYIYISCIFKKYNYYEIYIKKIWIDTLNSFIIWINNKAKTSFFFIRRVGILIKVC